MKVLFVGRSVYHFSYYESLLRALCEQGHQVDAVFDNTIEYFDGELKKLQLEKRHSAIDPNEMIKKIGDLFDSFRLGLSEQREKQAKLYNNNELRDQIDELFAGKIGTPPNNQEEIDNITQEGDKRFEKEIPPGYKDKVKGNDEIYVYRGLNIKRKVTVQHGIVLVN